MRALHFGLRVADLTRSPGFCTGLGYEAIGTVPETVRQPDDAQAPRRGVRQPRTRPRSARGSADPGGLNDFVIKMESMQATIAELAARGIHAGPPAPPDGPGDFWTSWLTDPDGYRIELVQWPAGHPDGMTQPDTSGQVARD